MNNGLFGDLGSFFTTENEDSIALSPEDEEVLSAYEALINDFPEINATTRCAFINYKRKCGSYGGTKAFV